MPNIGGTELITMAVILIVMLLGALVIAVLAALLLFRILGKNKKVQHIRG